MRRDAFTLIETMLAVLLLAVLASGVAIGFSRPLHLARADDAVNVVKAFDAAARQAAINFDKPVRMSFDLADGTLTRWEDESAAARVRLPSGYRIERTKIDGRTDSVGLVPVDVSPQGRSRTYAVHLIGPSLDRWIVFAGLTGLTTERANESDLPAGPRSARHDAD